jgi:hypothetical protein
MMMMIIIIIIHEPIPVALRSKAWVCGRLVAGMTGSNQAPGMDVCLLSLNFVWSCVGRGLCGWHITRPEESYRVSNCDYVNADEDKSQPEL